MTQKKLTLNSQQNRKLNYLQFLPDNYQTKEKWPLIISLHGSGERGDDLEKVKKYGIQQVLLQKPAFPFVVISPQCPENTDWANHFDLLTELLEKIQTELNIDNSKIYLTGFSMGAYGTWNYAIQNPNKFSAIVPIAGGAQYPKKANLLKNLPVWAFHGEEDKSVPISESQKVINVLKAVNKNVKFTTIPNAGHEVCTSAYQNPELYKWLLQQSK